MKRYQKEKKKINRIMTAIITISIIIFSVLMILTFRLSKKIDIKEPTTPNKIKNTINFNNFKNISKSMQTKKIKKLKKSIDKNAAAGGRKFFPETP